MLSAMAAIYLQHYPVRDSERQGRQRRGVGRSVGRSEHQSNVSVTIAMAHR